MGNTAYVAVGSAGMDIVDVTDPTAPTLLSNFDSAGNTVDLVVDQRIAYLANESAGIELVDVEDPSAPFLRGASSGRDAL